MAEPDQDNPSLDELANRAPTGFLGEYVAFLRHSKKWWLIPILVGILILGALTLLAATGAAPFIYTLF